MALAAERKVLVFFTPRLLPAEREAEFELVVGSDALNFVDLAGGCTAAAFVLAPTLKAVRALENPFSFVPAAD